MTSEPHGGAIASLRAVALDAPDIDLLATFYEQLAGWRRVPDDDDEWITIDSGDGWRVGLQRAPHHVPPPPPGRQPAAPQRTVAHTGRPGRPPVRPVRQPGRSADHPDGRHARLPRREGA